MVALSTPIACLLWAVACCTFEVCAQAAHIPMADPLPASCGPCRVGENAHRIWLSRHNVLAKT